MKIDYSPTYIPDNDKRPYTSSRSEIWVIFDRKAKSFLQSPYLQNELGVRRFIAQLLTLDNSIYRDNVHDFYAVRIGALVCSIESTGICGDGDTTIEFADIKQELDKHA